MVAALSQEREHEADPTTMAPEDDGPPLDVTSSLRVRKGATHWGIRRYTANGFERLSFGLHAFTKEPVFWDTKENYTGETILRFFGPGTYQINWRVIGDGKNQTIGREDINVRGALVGEPANVAPVQAQTVTCRACSADVLGRFCAACGTPAGEEARRSPPLAPPASSPPSAQAAPGSTAAVLSDPMAAFQLGVSFATSSMQSTAQIARADADARASRYEIDMKATLERERMAHEKAMRDQATFFDRTARAQPDPDVLVEKVVKLVAVQLAPLVERLSSIEESLEEEEDEDEEDEDEAPTPVVVQGAYTDKVNAAGLAVKEVVAPTIAAIGDAIKSMRSGNGNGATPHAQSGSGT